MRVLRPILPLSHPGLWQQFQYCDHGHWSFLSESLGVGRTVPYHHNCILAAFSQLSVHILNGETLM